MNKLMAKVNAKKTAMVGAAASALATMGFGFCVNDANTQAKTVMKAVFNVLMLAGIVLLAIGIVSLVRTIISIAGGEQSQPGAIGKALGMTLGGVVLAASKWLVQQITGQDPTTITLF